MFKKIFHPSDFSETSQVAFCHALRIALEAKADLRMLHVSQTAERSDYHYFPRVRDVLERWKVLDGGSDRNAVIGLGIDVEKLIIESSNTVAAISEFLVEHRSSLVVMGVHEHSAFLSPAPSRAEPIARAAGTTSLFVPDNTPGFVSIDTGEIQLRSIVVPITADPSPVLTVELVKQLVSTLGLEAVTIHLVHIGTRATLPAIPHDSTQGVEFAVHLVSGNVVPKIVEIAKELRADLVAATTAGHHGFLDALRGSTTEQVLRTIQCPLLAVTAR